MASVPHHPTPDGTAVSPDPARSFDPARQLAVIRRAVAKRSFCVLATSSARNRPHAVGVLYAAVDLTLYLLVSEDSVKVRNVRANPQVAVSIPVRRGPFGPPMAVQFQGTAEVLAVDDPHIRQLLDQGRLKRITGLGALDHPGACFLRITPGRRIASYGLGVNLIALMRDITLGARSVELP
jgi:general stress protein 26